MSPPETPQMQIRVNILVRILTVLEELKEDNRVTRRMLQTMAQRGNSGGTLSLIPDGFPLKTVREVEVMEEKLSDPSFMSELVTAVADIRGSTVDEATRRMMVFIVDHDLSRQYNFVGRNGKREFRTLKLFEVIFGALKKNTLTSEITRNHVERAVWLIGLRDNRLMFIQAKTSPMFTLLDPDYINRHYRHAQSGLVLRVQGSPSLMQR
ncbi:uncharacterized protein V3H82_023741 [Fundulus diaphanus]